VAVTPEIFPWSISTVVGGRMAAFATDTRMIDYIWNKMPNTWVGVGVDVGIGVFVGVTVG